MKMHNLQHKTMWIAMRTQRGFVFDMPAYGDERVARQRERLWRRPINPDYGEATVSAEICEEYYRMILDRLIKGKIEEKYRLKVREYEVKNMEEQLTLLEEQGSYLVARKKKCALKKHRF